MDCSPRSSPPGRHLIVPAGGTPAFLAPLPVGLLDRPELTELLDRLGIRTLGEFAALPDAHVLGPVRSRRGHLPSGGRGAERRTGRPAPAGDRQPCGSAGPGSPAPGPAAGEPGFWGGVSDTDARAGRALAAVQDLLGPDGVVTARLQGGRGPAQRARFVTWNARESHDDTTPAPRGPARSLPPAPALVHPAPLRAELVDTHGEPVVGVGTGAAHRRSGPAVGGAGPVVAGDRLGRAVAVGRAVVVEVPPEGARLQAVTGAGAHLLLAERGRWWVEATYG